MTDDRQQAIRDLADKTDSTVEWAEQFVADCEQGGTRLTPDEIRTAWDGTFTVAVAPLVKALRHVGALAVEPVQRAFDGVSEWFTRRRGDHP